MPLRSPLSLAVLRGASPGPRLALRTHTLIGRSLSSDIVLMDPYVSERHAVLSCDSRHVRLRDLCSERGTYVNGERLDGECLLSTGDLLEMGNSAFEVVSAGDSRPVAPDGPRVDGSVPDCGQPAVLLDSLTEALIGNPRSSGSWFPLTRLLRRLSTATTVRRVFLTTFTCSSGALSDLALAHILSTCSPNLDGVRIVVGDPGSDLEPVVHRLASICRCSRQKVLRELIRAPAPQSADSSLHAKILLLQVETGYYIAVVGSSNATFAGYVENCELNVALTWRFGDPYGLLATAEALWLESAPLQLPPLKGECARAGRIRPYAWQAARIRALRSLWRSLSRERPRPANSLPGYTVEMPPGTGKTLIAAELIRTIVRRGGRALWLSHRRVLLEQAAHTLERQLGRGVQVRTLQGHTTLIPDAPSVLIATDAALFRHLRSLARSRFNLIVIDESHRFGATRYAAIARALRTQMIVGLSATPGRRGQGAARRAFEEQFPRSTVVQRLPLAAALRLSERGHPVLAHVRHVSIETGWVMRAPAEDPWSLEFQERRQLGLFATCYTALVLAVHRLLLTSYAEEIGMLGPTIFFAVDVAHAARLERGLRAMLASLGQNVWIRQFHSKIPHVAHQPRARELQLRRDEFLTRARAGEQPVLIGVDIVSEGLDLPPVRTLMLARPTLSLRLYAQMIGRGLRGPAMGGGDYCNLVHFGAQTQIAGQRGRGFVDIRDVLVERAPRIETLWRLQSLLAHDELILRTRADSSASLESALDRRATHRG